METKLGQSFHAFRSEKQKRTASGATILGVIPKIGFSHWNMNYLNELYYFLNPPTTADLLWQSGCSGQKSVN